MKLFPSNIKLKAVCIESEHLLNDCKLTSNKNLCINESTGFEKCDLEKYLFDYYTRQQYSLNISPNLPHLKQLTEIGEVLNLNWLNEMDVNSHTTFSDGNDEFELSVIDSGRVDFVLYWYELSDKNVMFTPFRGFGLENREDTGVAMQLAAFSFLEKTKTVERKTHDRVRLNYLFKNEIFYVRSIMPSEND